MSSHILDPWLIISITYTGHMFYMVRQKFFLTFSKKSLNTYFCIQCNNWVSSRENLSSAVCEQHRRRPACASAQSDKRLCYSLFGKYHTKTCFKWNLNFLVSLFSWGDWFETCFVGNPEDRFSRDEAHIFPCPVSESCLWHADLSWRAVHWHTLSCDIKITL